MNSAGVNQTVFEVRKIRRLTVFLNREQAEEASASPARLVNSPRWLNTVEVPEPECVSRQVRGRYHREYRDG